MTNFLTLTCPTCGSKLDITPEIERFACASCGNEHLVNRHGGIVSIKPMIEGLASIKIGVDKTASELAIVRLEKEIRKYTKDLNDVIADKANEKTFNEKWVDVLIMVFALGCLYTLIVNEIGFFIFFAVLAILLSYLKWETIKRLRTDYLKSQAIYDREAQGRRDRFTSIIINKNNELRTHKDIVKIK